MVGMVNDACRRTAMLQRHLERCDGEFGAQMCAMDQPTTRRL